MNILKHNWLLLPLFLISVAVSSCSFSDFMKPSDPVPTYAYDLEIPQPLPVPGAFLEVKQISGSSRSKMAKRTGNRVEFDQNGRWSQPPEALLTRYLTLSFAGQDEKSVSEIKEHYYIFSGNLLDCIYDKDSKQFRMQIQYSIMKQSSIQSSVTVTKEYSAAMNEDKADCYAKAFTECANHLADDLRKLLKSKVAGQ